MHHLVMKMESRDECFLEKKRNDVLLDPTKHTDEIKDDQNDKKQEKK